MRLPIVWFSVLAACAGGHQIGPGDDSSPDARGDGGHDPSGDGGGIDAPGHPVTCGGSVCRADQACNAGVCTFGCVGSTVPGDYATIQAAIDALAATGADTTICLAATSYVESTIYLRDQGAHHKALRIIGESMDRTTINTDVYILGGWSRVTLQGTHISAGSRTALHAQGGNGETLDLIGTKLSGTTGLDAYQRQTITVDGCEVETTNGYGISLYANVSGPLAVRVENSYLHGGYAVRAATNGYTVNLTFVHNTVKGGDVGVDLSGATTAVLANNIFTDTTSFAMQWLAPATVTRQNNALWNNVTNYAGLASDGPGYVKTDCMLDLSGRVPALRASSPCRGAGDGAVGSPHDFFGATRGTPPDIGAVEAP